MVLERFLKVSQLETTVHYYNLCSCSFGLLYFDTGFVYIREQDGPVSSAVLWLLLPLVLPVFALIDVIIIFPYCYRYCRLETSRKKCCLFVLTCVGCVIIIIFIQLLVFYIGWMLPLLVAFPMTIVTLILVGACMMLYTFFAICCIAALMQYCYSVGRTVLNCRVPPAVKPLLIIYENASLAVLSTCGFCMTLMYYTTQSSNDDGSHDVIVTIAAAAFPTVLIGLTTWMVNKYLTTNPIQDEVSAERTRDTIYGATTDSERLPLIT